jgi:hypothetical protein
MKRIKFSNILSWLAILVSLLGLYFQFFDVRHKLLFTPLEPSSNEEKKEFYIPLLLKNAGNQTEIILKSSLFLEIKSSNSNQPNEGTFKRFSLTTPPEFPMVLSPNEYKRVVLTGDYKTYFFGTLDHMDNGKMKYTPIIVYDSLTVLLGITYLSKSGIAREEKYSIGFLSFDRNENIKRIDYAPIKLREIDLSNDDKEIMSCSIIPQVYKDSCSIDLKDTNSIKKNYDKIQMMNRILSNRK